MPIRPTGSEVYLTLSGSTKVAVVRSVKYQFEIEFFERNEFSNERLRQAKNTDGSKPLFIETFGGQVGQFISTCVGGSARPLVPDDANIDNIKKKFNIRRYQLSGDANQTHVVQFLQDIHNSHRILLARYQAHLAQVQMDISYSALVAMQAETFSYLTTTGLHMYGNAISPTGILSAGISSGAGSLTTSVADEFEVGQYLIINPKGGTTEALPIASISSPTIGLTGTTSNAHSAGEIVSLFERDLLITEFTPEVDREYSTSSGPVVRKVWEMTIESRVIKAARAVT